MSIHGSYSGSLSESEGKVVTDLQKQEADISGCKPHAVLSFFQLHL